MARARHVSKSCDLSSLTSSAAHSRASGIFPASRKARAFAKAWLSADRSAGDSFPEPAPRAARPADDMLRIDLVPAVRHGFTERQISTVNAYDRNVYLCLASLALALLRIEPELAPPRRGCIAVLRSRSQGAEGRTLELGVSLIDGSPIADTITYRRTQTRVGPRCDPIRHSLPWLSSGALPAATRRRRPATARRSRSSRSRSIPSMGMGGWQQAPLRRLSPSRRPAPYVIRQVRSSPLAGGLDQPPISNFSAAAREKGASVDR